jgi:FkbH-like protein
MVMKYTEILAINTELFCENKQSYDILLLSNMITQQIKELLEFSLRSNKINAVVNLGNYNNIVQDSLDTKSANCVILFWEACNLIDAGQTRINLLNEADLAELVSNVKSQILLVFENLSLVPLVIFNKFSSLLFNSQNIKQNNFDYICEELNSFVSKTKPANVILVGTDKIIAQISVSASIDYRYFYTSKSIYTIEFYRAYSNYIAPIVFAVNGFSKKALLLDCDNTLWDGILGEDGFEGIKMSSLDKKGCVFSEIQAMAKELSNQGVLLCLCSKNNPDDVRDVLLKHPDMMLSIDQITLSKVNWNEKITNIQEAAKELNIGLDSFVFLDDSDFEVNFIRNSLPEVVTLQVPTNLYEYPAFLRQHANLFFKINSTAEDAIKAKMYQEQLTREAERVKHNNVDDYLNSLELAVTILINDRNNIPRISQLTQKTNQFNLTTQRYTETEISALIENQSVRVFSMSVVDKFGDYGLTALSIVNIEGGIARISDFLMSCRILGRRLDFILFDYIVKTLRESGALKINSSYKATQRNSQVHNFYDSLGFTTIIENDICKEYELELETYFQPVNMHIKVNNA